MANEAANPPEQATTPEDGLTPMTIRCQSVPGSVTCSQFGPISAMSVKIEHLDKKTDELDTTCKSIAENFNELKLHCIEHDGKLERILENLQTTLELSVKEHQKYDKAVEKHAGDIVNMQKDISTLQGDVSNVRENIADHGKRISGLERVSYWVYAGVAVLVIIAFIVANWSTSKDIIVDNRGDVTIKEGPRSTK